MAEKLIVKEIWYKNVATVLGLEMLSQQTFCMFIQNVQRH